MSGKHTNGLHSEEVIAKMLELKELGVMSEFADYVFDIMCKHEDEVINGGEEKDKVHAIKLVLEYYISVEDYEKCGVLRDFLIAIDEASK